MNALRKNLKAPLITVIGFLSLIAFLVIFAVRSCTSTVNHLVDQAFDIKQEVRIKNGVYHIRVPLRARGYFIELSAPDLETLCIDPDRAPDYQSASGSAQCFNGYCRFYFNDTIPDTLEYLTLDEQGQCTVSNAHPVDKRQVKTLYELTILVPAKVAGRSSGTLEISATKRSQFESYTDLSIGVRIRIDFDYSVPIRSDQLLINGTLFILEVDSRAARTP